MKKSLLVIFLVCMLGSLVFAGGQGESDGVIELRYMMWDPQIIEKEEALAAEFHQQFPNVKVTVEAAAFAQFWQKMQAMAAAKNMPDVFWMSSGYVKDYARLGAIRKLDEFVSNYDPDYFFEKSFNVLRAPNFQGDLYAFPWAVVTNISYYNIRMFDEAGLAYPTNDWTFDDLRSLAKKLSKDTDGDGAYDVWGYHVKGRYTHLFPFVYNNGAELTDGDFKDFQVTQGAGLEAMKFLSDLVVVDKTSPTPAQMQGISKPFTTGKVGMTTEGTWRIDSYRSGLEDDFGIVMVPKGPQSGGKDVVFGWADAYSVSAFTKHAQESWDWIMFMAGPGRPIDSIVGGKIPAWKESAYSEEWLEKDMLPTNKELVLQSADLIGESVTLPPRFDEWNSAVQSDFDKISLGEGEFYAVMKELDAKVESILARK